MALTHQENRVLLESILTEFQDRSLQEFRDLTDRLHGDKDKDAVNLGTIHSAKGLEFDTVFIIGLDDSTLPHYRGLAVMLGVGGNSRIAVLLGKGETRQAQRFWVWSVS